MICPECSHPAMSFGRFALQIYPQHLTCRHCGAKLTWSARWSNVFRISLVVCLISAVVLSIFRQLTGISLLVYIAVIAVAALIFDMIFWRRSVYEKTAELKS